MRSRSRTTSRSNSLSIYSLIGKGYESVWWTNYKGRYKALKGARNTKKSYDFIGWESLDKILSDPRRNVLFIRKTQKTHRTSTWPTIKRIINQPIPNDPTITLNPYFKFNESNLTITYKPTGQKIIMLGFDDPQKLQGIQVEQGYLTDVYVEEAFEIDDYEQWQMLDGSIRGKMPDGLGIQITFLFNSWYQDHWLYNELFKGRLEDDAEYLDTHDHMEWIDPDLILGYGKGLALHISTFRINEFRDKDVYDPAMHELRMRAPEIYKVVALGCWGNATEGTYPEWGDHLIITEPQANTKQYAAYAIGIDTGLSDGQGKIKRGEQVRIRSATTMQLIGVTADYSQLVAIDEYFHSNDGEFTKKTEPELIKELVQTLIEWRDRKYRTHPQIMKGTICVYVDSADKGFLQGMQDECRRQGLFGIAFQPSTKERIQTRVDFVRYLMAYGEFVVSRACPNLIREIKNSRRGEDGRVREDFDDHAINANEYAWAVLAPRLRRWRVFKPH